MTAPPIRRTAVVARPIDEAFAVFTEEIGAWWPLPTHSVFGAQAGGVHFVDGRLVERSTDGRESVWAEVLEWDPPRRLALAWHPGSDGSTAGRVEVTFDDDADGTRVQICHDGWEAFGEDALRKRRSYAGPSAWGHVLDHYADGAEEPVDGPDLSALESAYESFFATAASGSFGSPSDGGWTADQVIAHVALNDLAMTAVAQELIHRGDPSFENHTCQVLDTLDATVESFDTQEGLIAFGRRCSAQAVAALRRLDDDQLAHDVPCRFEHGGEIVMEERVPWGRVAVDIQAARHLPAHVEQLENLRG